MTWPEPANASKIDRMRAPSLCLPAMKRIAAIGISVLLLWALIPGVGEVLENAVHFAQEGHSAHAVPAGDHHDPPGPEHGCSGTLHLCSCCASLSFLSAHVVAQVPALGTQQLIASLPAHLPAISSGGVYHPPRA